METFFGVPISAYRRFAREWGPFTFVLLLFFLSGASGLIYQVVWTRKLVLLFGTTAYAVSTVLSVFFLGLGIGSLWGGRLADRSKHPLRLYGAFEILIGIWAALFIFGIDRGEFIVADALKLFAASRTGGVALRALLAVVFLIVPVTLMGATLPLLSKSVGRSDATRGMRIGLLYVINTIGAVTGCVFAGVYGIEVLGYTQTTFVAAAGNIAIGLLALAAAKMFANVRDDAPSPMAIHGPSPPRPLSIVPMAFAVSGFCTLALEVLWTRLLTLVFMGTTYAYTAMLASILVGIAVGSFIAATLADRTKSPAFALGIVECAAGIACAATLIYIKRLPETLQYFAQQTALESDGRLAILFASTFTVLLVPTIFIGMTFPFAVRAVAASHARLGNDVGRLYGLNTFGGVLGAIAGGYLILPLIGAHRGIVGLGVVLLFVGVLLILTSAPRAAAKFVALLFVGCASGYVAYRLPHDVNEALNRSYLPPEHRVVAYKEGIEGTIVVSEPEGNTGNSNRALWINGVQATQSILKGIRMNRFEGVLPFVFDREPKTALLICFGSGITAGTLSASNLDVTGVELSRDVLGMAHLFEEDNWHALENPRLHMTVDDGRNFLLTHDGRYDIITFEPMPLAVSGVATFYSTEFYELCRMRLAPDGIVVQWAPLHGTNLEVIRTLLRTFHDVFPECTAWFVNSDLFIVGSLTPLHISIANAERRMTEPKIADGMRHVGFNDTADLLSSYFMSGDAIAAFANGAPAMTDDRPWVEFLVPRVLYKETVGESLSTLIPYLESPDTIAVDGDWNTGNQALRERLAVRYRARKLALKGVEVTYRTGPAGSPERYFEQALEIDPTEPLARAYYSEIAPQLLAQLLRQKHFAEAEQLVERFDRYFLDSADVWKLRVQLYNATGRPDQAAEAQRRLDSIQNQPTREYSEAQ